MEVFTVSTPTSSGNYKVFLESAQDETLERFACRESPEPKCEKSYLRGMRTFWPAATSTDESELIS